MGNQTNRVSVMGYENTYAEFEKSVFQEGTGRRVYRGTFHGDSRLEGKKCVVKVNKEPYSYDRAEHEWESDKRAYEVADKMAERFNEKYNTTKPIKFVKPEFTEIDPQTVTDFLGFNPYGKDKNMPKTVTVAIERYLDGDYVKFTSNVGYVHPKQMATPAAFSHFTYDESNGDILVCDLQGVRTDISYELTDPAVLSSGKTPQYYGLSDCGELGVVKFFETHRCNVLCEKLKKPRRALDCTNGEWVEFNNVVGKIPVDKSTMHTYQLMKSCDLSTADLENLQNKRKLEAVKSE